MSDSPHKAPSKAAPVDHTLRRTPWHRYATPFDRILAHPYRGAGTRSAPFAVDWLPGDAEDPQNWPTAYRWTAILVTSTYAFAVAMSSSAYVGGVPSLLQQFPGVSQTVWTGGVCTSPR